MPLLESSLLLAIDGPMRPDEWIGNKQITLGTGAVISVGGVLGYGISRGRESLIASPRSGSKVSIRTRHSLRLFHDSI